MNAAATQWSAPVTPGGGSAEREWSPLRIVVDFVNGSSGFQLNGSSAPSAPSFSGTQYPGAIPCGTNSPTNRGFGLAAVWASTVAAGTMASSSGSDNIAPAPRNTVRLEMCFFERNMGPLEAGLNARSYVPGPIATPAATRVVAPRP